MKWFVVLFAANLAGICAGGALRCAAGSEDTTCSEDTTDSAVPAVPAPAALPSGKECAAGSTWTSQCNDCACSPNGYSFCTEKACTEKSDHIFRCAPESRWINECNTCWCSSQGYPACTLKGCFTGTLIPIEDQNAENKETEPNNSQIRRTRSVDVKEPPKACQPGQSFRLDCNTCLCDNEGQDFSCTRNDCNAVNGNKGGGERTKRESTTELIPMECITDSVFDRDCNVCRCTDGKHAMCTTKRCSLPQAKDKKDEVTPLPNLNPDFRCNPGEQFKRGCNDCSCSADGKSVFCTVRFCDQDIASVPSA